MIMNILPVILNMMIGQSTFDMIQEQGKKDRKEEETRNLEKIIKKDSTGKPILNLTLLEKTVVNTLTQEEYNELMRVYEIGSLRVDESLRGGSEILPTELDLWNDFKEKTCIGVEEGQIVYAGKPFYLKRDFKIISPGEFYDKQKITYPMLKEINNYFEKKK